MKKILLGLVFIFTITFLSNAQEGIAKIKFGEAEQAFTENDFQKTIAKLDEVEKILKQSNPKILYLRIKAENALLQQNPWTSYSSIEKLRKSCSFYLNEYDGKAPMDKYKEVFDVSEELKKYPATAEEFNKLKEEKIRKEREEEKIQRDLKNQQIVDEMTHRINGKKKDHAAYFHRGRAKLELGDLTGALDDLNKAVSLSQNYAGYYFIRGEIYYQMYEYLKASEDYSKGIQLNPNIETTYLARAYSYFSLKEYSKAIEDYTKALQLNSQNAESYSWRGYTFYTMKEYSKAADDYTNAIQLDPQNSDLYSKRGRIFYEYLKDKVKGEADFKKVLELGENSSSNVAYANYFLGNKTTAFKSLQENIASGDKVGTWNYDLACLYSLDRNKELALKYLKTSFENGNNTQWAQQDDDLVFIRDTPEFKALIEQYSTKK